MNQLNFLLSSISILKGIGEKTFKLYKKLLIPKRFFEQEPKIIDLLYHKPIKIQNRKTNPNINDIFSGDIVTLNVIVQNINKPYKKSQPYKINCITDTGFFINIIYFNTFQNYIDTIFKEGKKIKVSGKIEKFNNEIQMIHPDYVNTDNIPIYEQIYQLTAGITNKMLRYTIQTITKKIIDFPEWLEESFIKKHNYTTWKNSILSIHNAKTEDDILPTSPYISRLAFDEILANQIALGIIRKKNKKEYIKTELQNKTNSFKEYFLKELPFELTNDQKKVITEIENDIFSKNRMMRLLQGDVGSGKTVVAFFTMLPYIENKKQVALMVPTSILATQHFEWIQNICKNKDIKVELLTGKIKGKKRDKIYKDLIDGNIDILIGTHAIFQENVKFKNLAYVIIDEQHRFGVSQRFNLIEKGKDTDILIMTATPIPRTLSLTIYGDVDLSIIKEKPKNRKEIITSMVSKKNFNKLIERIKYRISIGEKIYWICPLIEENETLKVTPLFQRYEEFVKIFGENKIAFVHGKLKEDEKDKIIEDFKNGEKKILIATTVIEVGIDVPDATIIIIENPDRFGLAQLHQLRGRVGRGDKQSYCVLFYDKITKTSFKRMKILQDSNDGFYIAEEDLKLRGNGDILGTQQSGYQEYLVANLFEHHNLLLEANKMANEIINDTQKLNSTSIKILLKLFGYEEYLNIALLQ